MNQTKWRVRLPREGKMGGVEVIDGDKYVCTMSHHPAERKEAVQYAERIVACVNACEGIPTASVEDCCRIGGLKKIDQTVLEQNKIMMRLKRQRDELLAALEAFTSAQDAKRSASGKGAGPIAAAISDLIIAEEKAREAIARIKGGAA